MLKWRMLSPQRRQVTKLHEDRLSVLVSSWRALLYFAAGVTTVTLLSRNVVEVAR